MESVVNIVIATFFSFDVMVAQQDTKRKQEAMLKDIDLSEKRRDEQQAPYQLLPLRSAYMNQVSWLQAFFGSSSFFSFLFGISQERNVQSNYKLTIVGLGCIMLLFMLLKGISFAPALQGTIVWHGFMTFTIGILASLFHKDGKMSFAFMQLFVATSFMLEIKGDVIIEEYYLDANEKWSSLIQLTQSELALYMITMTVLVQVYDATQLRYWKDTAASESQQSVNMIASVIFSDYPHTDYLGDAETSAYGIVKSNYTPARQTNEKANTQGCDLKLLRYSALLEKVLCKFQTLSPQSFGVSSISYSEYVNQKKQNLDFTKSSQQSLSASTEQRQLFENYLFDKLSLFEQNQNISDTFLQDQDFVKHMEARSFRSCMQGAITKHHDDLKNSKEISQYSSARLLFSDVFQHSDQHKKMDHQHKSSMRSSQNSYQPSLQITVYALRPMSQLYLIKVQRVRKKLNRLPATQEQISVHRQISKNRSQLNEHFRLNLNTENVFSQQVARRLESSPQKIRMKQKLFFGSDLKSSDILTKKFGLKTRRRPQHRLRSHDLLCIKKYARRSSLNQPKRKILTPSMKFEKIKEEEQNVSESESEFEDYNDLQSQTEKSLQSIIQANNSNYNSKFHRFQKNLVDQRPLVILNSVSEGQYSQQINKLSGKNQNENIQQSQNLSKMSRRLSNVSRLYNFKDDCQTNQLWRPKSQKNMQLNVSSLGQRLRKAIESTIFEKRLQKKQTSKSLAQFNQNIEIKSPVLLKKYSIESASSQKSAANSASKVQIEVKNNRIFVYKIIHDLRHPTEALSNGLQRLLDLLKSRVKLTDSFNSTVVQNIDRKKFKTAVAYLKNFMMKQESCQQRSNLTNPNKMGKIIGLQNLIRYKSQNNDKDKNTTNLADNKIQHEPVQAKNKLVLHQRPKKQEVKAVANIKSQPVKDSGLTLEKKIMKMQKAFWDLPLVRKKNIQKPQEEHKQEVVQKKPISQYRRSEEHKESKLSNPAQQSLESIQLSSNAFQSDISIQQQQSSNANNFYKGSIRYHKGDSDYSACKQNLSEINSINRPSNLSHSLDEKLMQQKRMLHDSRGEKNLNFSLIPMNNKSTTIAKANINNEQNMLPLDCIKLVLIERQELLRTITKIESEKKETQKQIISMQGQVQMMLSLMRDLMNQAQLANNTFTMINSYFDCIQLVKSCMVTVSALANAREVILEGPKMSNHIDKFYFKQLFSDRQRYSQVILNFLSNAIKFTQKGGSVSVLFRVLKIKDLNEQSVELKHLDDDQEKEDVSISWSNSDEANQKFQNIQEEKEIEFEMTFRDSGCGISQENQQKLFTNFSKLHETNKANPTGVGLGLSINREIIMALGGEVKIESELGKGTDFIIRLQSKCLIDPNQISAAHEQFNLQGYLSSSYVSSNSSQSLFDLEESNLELEILDNDLILSNVHIDRKYQGRLSCVAEGSGDIEEDVSSLQKSVKKKRETVCLLANDNNFLLEGFKVQLSSHFDIVETAENGKEALEAVKSHPRNFYKAIILDINMPIMDGMQACELIQTYFKEEIITTALAKVPLIYALTSEVEKEMIMKIKQAGFKEVFQELSQNNISLILNNAGQLSEHKPFSIALDKQSQKSYDNFSSESDSSVKIQAQHKALITESNIQSVKEK